MFATADYDVANEGHDKPYTYGRSKYPRWSCERKGRGLRRAEGRRLKCLGIYDHGAHARGVAHSLSHSHSFCLRNSRSAIFKCYTCSFLSGYSPYNLFFLLISKNNPCSLCNQSRYTQLFTFKIYEVVSALIRVGNIQTVTGWRRNGTAVVTHVGAWSTSRWLVFLKANGLQIPLPCSDNKTSSCIALAFDLVSCLCIFNLCRAW
jgi:hypothetical protein